MTRAVEAIIFSSKIIRHGAEDMNKSLAGSTCYASGTKLCFANKAIERKHSSSGHASFQKTSNFG
jgi:hypothetical protein